MFWGPGHPLLWGDTSELKHVQNKPHLCRFHGMSTVAPFGSALGVFPSPGQHHCQPQGSVSLPNVPPTNPLRVHMSHTNESPAIPVVVPTPRPHQQAIHTKGRWTHHKILRYSPSPAASTPSIPKKRTFLGPPLTMHPLKSKDSAPKREESYLVEG